MGLQEFKSLTLRTREQKPPHKTGGFFLPDYNICFESLTIEECLIDEKIWIEQITCEEICIAVIEDNEQADCLISE